MQDEVCEQIAVASGFSVQREKPVSRGETTDTSAANNGVDGADRRSAPSQRARGSRICTGTMRDKQSQVKARKGAVHHADDAVGHDHSRALGFSHLGSEIRIL